MPLTIENKRDKTPRNRTIYFSKITSILKVVKPFLFAAHKMPSWISTTYGAILCGGVHFKCIIKYY